MSLVAMDFRLAVFVSLQEGVKCSELKKLRKKLPIYTIFKEFEIKKFKCTF